MLRTIAIGTLILFVSTTALADVTIPGASTPAVGTGPVNIPGASFCFVGVGGVCDEPNASCTGVLSGSGVLGACLGPGSRCIEAGAGICGGPVEAVPTGLASGHHAGVTLPAQTVPAQTVPSCFAQNPSALTNACVDSAPRTVHVPTPTVSPAPGPCVIGNVCAPGAQPGVGSTPIEAVGLNGYVEATAACGAIGEACRVDLP